MGLERVQGDDYEQHFTLLFLRIKSSWLLSKRAELSILDQRAGRGELSFGY